MNRTLAIISTLLLLLQPPTYAVQTSTKLNETTSDISYCHEGIESNEQGKYETEQQQIIASKITVLVKGDNNSGSGTLLAKQGNGSFVLSGLNF